MCEKSFPFFPSRISTHASGRELLRVKRRAPDSSLVQFFPDTARIASGELRGQIHDPGGKLEEQRGLLVDCAPARLHLFVERMRHGKEIYVSP